MSAPNANPAEVNEIMERFRTHVNRLGIARQRVDQVTQAVAENWQNGVFDGHGFYQLTVLWPQASEALTDCFADMREFMDAGERDLGRMIVMWEEIEAEKRKYGLD